MNSEPLAVLLPPEALLRKRGLVIWHGGVLRVPTGIAVTLAVDAPTRVFLDPRWESKSYDQPEALSVTASGVPNDGHTLARWTWYTPLPRSLRYRAVFDPGGHEALDLTFEVRPLGLAVERRIRC